jgi:hypothetical protein
LFGYIYQVAAIDRPGGSVVLMEQLFGGTELILRNVFPMKPPSEINFHRNCFYVIKTLLHHV